MAEYIFSILRSQLMVVFSWGFHSPARLAGDAGLAFQVNGYKYSGAVDIVYDESADLFDVILSNNGTRIEGVYADQLVEVIDNAVERTDDYEKRVRKSYEQFN